MTTLSNAALRYADRGLHVFPLQERGKRPYPRSGGFHDATSDLRRVRSWWRAFPLSNIGCAPGPSGFLVLDVDGAIAEPYATELGAFDEPTLTVATGRDGGRHLYFRRPDFVVTNAKPIPECPQLEVRCDGGYVVLPPSIHPSGARYRWLGTATTMAPCPPLLVEALRHASSALAEPEQLASAPATAPTHEELDRRVRAYVAKLGNRGEGDRNNAAFRLAAWLLRDMALPDDVARAYLADWNRGNTPPLRSRELLSAFASARKHGRRTPGSGVVRDRRPFRSRPFADLKPTPLAWSFDE